jgi:hypothetical protein
MRADLHGGRSTSAPAILNPSAFCRLLDEQRFPDLGFLEIVSAQYAPWADPDYLVHLTLRHQVTRQPVKQTLIVRNCGDNAETVFRAARELWARVFCRSETLSMAMPLGTLADKGLLLQVLPQGPTLLDLLQDRRDSLFHAGVRTWARWLAKLHDARQGCEALPIRLDSELRQELAEAHRRIVATCPTLQGLADSVAEDLHHTLSASPNPLLPTLGSSHLDRFYFHNEVFSPVDFDGAALGDPAADIGFACADLELAILQATSSQDTADRAVDSFVSEYRRHGGAEPFGRIGRYRALRHVLQIREALQAGPIDPQQISLWLVRAQAFLTKSHS